jgi:hypothetical protein
VSSLRQQAEAVGGEADHELEHEERRRSDD